MTRPSVHDCELYGVAPYLMTREGNITPLHGGEDLPFEIRRVFYLYDIPGENPGEHTPIKYATNLSSLQLGRSMFFSMMVVSRGLLL